MSMQHRTLLVAASTLLVAACAEPEDASTSNFSATAITGVSGGSLGLSTDGLTSLSASASESASASAGESDSDSDSGSSDTESDSGDTGDTDGTSGTTDGVDSDSDSDSEGTTGDSGDSDSDSEGTTGDSEGTTGDSDSDSEGTTGDSDSGGEFPDGAVFVHIGLGLDSNPGTAEAPKRSIQAGIAAAVDNAGGEVFVAQGIYEVDFQNNKYITLADGVSLFGGYKADDWESRDVTAFTTEIVDKSATGGTSSEPIRALDGGVGVGVETIVEGFTIRGGRGAYAAAVRIVDSSPTLRHNRILGDGGQGGISYGLWIANGAPEVYYNVIEAGKVPGLSAGHGVHCRSQCSGIFDGNYIGGGSGGSTSYGLYLKDSVAGVYNNVIDGGNGSSNPSGIYLIASPSEILNNTLISSQPSKGYGIFGNSSKSSARIENNIITATNTCIYESSSTTQFATIKNNDLHCTTYTARTGYDNKWQQELAPMETSFKNGGAMASGNIKIAPTFVNANTGDYRLKGGGDTFCDLSQGALELAMSFLLDRDAIARTKPWSIGA